MIIERNSDTAPEPVGVGAEQHQTVAAPETTTTAATADDVPADVAAELRTLLSLRTRTSARDRHLPHLTALLPSTMQQDPDSRFASLVAMVDAGIAAMPDIDHSTAAATLLGSGSGRWRPLSARGPEAAAPFGCGWDAYRRRRRSTGSSLLEETVALLARTLLDLAAFASLPDPPPGHTGQPATAGSTRVAKPATEPFDAHTLPEVRIGPPPTIDPARGAETAPDTTDLGTDEKRRGSERSKVALAAASALIVVITAAAILAWVVTSTAEPDDPVDCGSFDREVGATAAGADSTLQTWGRAFRTHVEAEGITEVTRCASHLSDWRHGAIQRVGGGRSTDIHALLGSRVDGDEVVVVLEPSELRAFGRATDKHGPHQGAPLGEVMGHLVARSEGPGGERVVRFSDGLIITEATESPSWAVLGSWVEIWEETGGLAGGLGRPVGDRRGDRAGGGLVQQFERGTISSTTDGVVQVAVDQDHYALALPEDPRNTVLVTTPGDLWWYVDAEGVRHFVTGSDLACVGRTMGVPVIGGQHPAAVATLPAGEGFECP